MTNQDTTEPIEVITRYEKGKPDEYSFDGGKTFGPKPTKDTTSIDEQIEDLLEGVNWCETCNHPRCISNFMSKREAIKALISDQVASAIKEAEEAIALKVLQQYDQANMPHTLTVPEVDYTGSLTIPNGEHYKATYKLLKDVKDTMLGTLNGVKNK